MNMPTEKRQEMVNKLTAIGLILFELTETIEETTPTVTQHTSEAIDNIITLIKELVIEEYAETETILETPKFNVDVSHRPGNELSDLKELTEQLGKIKAHLDNTEEMLCSAARLALNNATIEMVQALRPTYKETGESKNPWDYLTETE